MWCLVLLLLTVPGFLAGLVSLVLGQVRHVACHGLLSLGVVLSVFLWVGLGLHLQLGQCLVLGLLVSFVLPSVFAMPVVTSY